MGRRSLTKGAGLGVIAVLAIYALLGGDLGQDDGAGDSKTRSTGTTTAATTTATEAAFSPDETRGISDTLAAIEAGDLPFEQDGSTFQNREGLLPDRDLGYYREYTVITPGSDDRGARRLVIGEEGDTWYTRDHYNSFVRIEPADFREDGPS